MSGMPRSAISTKASEGPPTWTSSSRTRELVSREKGLDEMMWNKIDELNTFDYFNVSTVLGYIAKLKIIDRWLKLDEATGREMFRQLVSEIRGTFKGVEFNET